MAINSILHSAVFHKRLNPSVNKFSYDVYHLCLNIDEIDNINCKFLSIDKFNLFSIYQKNHGARDSSNIKDWIYQILKENNIKNITKIYLLTHPKILQLGFNPVSFWFCLDKDDNIVTVLAEVNNTFGEHHNYLVKNDDDSPIISDQWLEAKKEFHVSPFYNVKGNYKFRFLFNKKKIAVWIDYYDGTKTLLTSLIGNRVDLNDKNLLKAFISYPFMIIKVISLIHWQALKLFVKGNKYIPKPKKIKQNLTISGKV